MGVARGIAVGAALGALLSAGNLYGGLKIGWSASTALIGVIVVQAASTAVSRRASSEATVIAATACAAAGAAPSAGLAAAVPGLEIVRGTTLSFPLLALWIFAVCALGAGLALVFRPALVEDRALVFPGAVAVREAVYAPATGGARVLASSAVAAAATRFALRHAGITSVALPFAGRGTLLAKLGFALDPSFLLFGIGGLVGARAALSTLLGAIVAYGGFAPMLLASGRVVANAEGSAFRELSAWLAWPGIAILIGAAVVMLATAARSTGAALVAVARGGAGRAATAFALAAGAAVATLLAVALRVSLVAAASAVVATILLAAVGARAQGSTGVTPIGPLARVTQLATGLTAPGDVAANLACGAATGGGVAHCTELTSALRAGRDVGADARVQAIAYVVGAASGALASAGFYRLLVTSPETQLVTPEWPAPALVQWRAFAEVLARGPAALPPGALAVSFIALAVALALALIERRAPRVAAYLPSPTALGLGFVIAPSQSLTLALGGVAAAVALRARPSWTRASWAIACAGLVVGESLAGVALTAWKALSLRRVGGELGDRARDRSWRRKPGRRERATKRGARRVADRSADLLRGRSRRGHQRRADHQPPTVARIAPSRRVEAVASVVGRDDAIDLPRGAAERGVEIDDHRPTVEVRVELVECDREAGGTFVDLFDERFRGRSAERKPIDLERGEEPRQIGRDGAGTALVREPLCDPARGGEERRGRARDAKRARRPRGEGRARVPLEDHRAVTRALLTHRDRRLRRDETDVARREPARDGADGEPRAPLEENGEDGTLERAAAPERAKQKRILGDDLVALDDMRAEERRDGRVRSEAGGDRGERHAPVRYDHVAARAAPRCSARWGGSSP